MTQPIGETIKQEKFKSNYNRAVINVLYTSNFIRDAYSKVFAAENLQSPHFNVLRILKGKYPNNVQPGYIKEVMLDRGCDLTRLLDKLQKLGYITRSADTENKRKMNVKLTQTGLKLVDKMSTKIDLIDSHIRKNITEDECQLLSNLLDKLRMPEK
jgi:DNA-binding MarR family transcriptional regulator